MDNNPVEELPEDLFKENPMLAQFSLTWHRLSALPESFFSHTPNIERIVVTFASYEIICLLCKSPDLYLSQLMPDLLRCQFQRTHEVRTEYI